VPEELREEIAPKNIIMIGPTGVGKTEVARRLAKLSEAPFIKVEASKFTEVGYVGRDVESIIRDLCELAINMTAAEEQRAVRARAEEIAEERLLDALLPAPIAGPPETGAEPSETREKLRKLLRLGELDDRVVEIEVADESGGPSLSIMTPQGVEEMGVQFKDLLGSMMPRRTQRRQMKVAEARGVLEDEAAAQLVDHERVRERAVRRVEQSGIVFIDEIDKVAVGAGGKQGPDVSREGVQRDLLPIVEGSTVQTKHGPIRTDHILFIAAGAFHLAKPSDLIPELQGRFPIRVELASLREADLVRILTEPTNSLVRQYTALLATEGIVLEFKEGGLRAIARLASLVNERSSDIGARRLHTVMEKLLEPLSFDAPDMRSGQVVIDEALVEERLSELVENPDVSNYIL
jgi:ATP-dependent HslUV protease ATP-binding subunit HslU